MNKHFGVLLSEGISSIAHRWHKTNVAVCRDMTQQLREAGFDLTDSTLSGWCRGFVPKKSELVAWIVCYCIQRGRVDRHWVEALLRQANYPDRVELLNELFPITSQPALSSRQQTRMQQLQYVDDPMLMLRLTSADLLIGRATLLASLKEQLRVRQYQGMQALSGLPGVGKTTLAMELVQSREVQEMFCDGILYANLGPQPDIEYHLERWAKLLGVMLDTTQAASRQAYIHAIHASIGRRQMLLLIDDAWTTDAALALQLGGPQCAHILTTRFADIALQFAGQGVTKVSELNESESIQLLTRFVPQIVVNEQEQIRTLVQLVGGLPLALTLMGKHLQRQAFHRQPRRLQDALSALQQAAQRLRLESPQRPLEDQRQASLSLIASIDMSYQALSSSAQRALRSLCIFLPKPNTFSEEAALMVSASIPATLDELIDAGILESAPLPGRYTLHQTIVDYASLKRRGQQAELRLIEYFVYYAKAHMKENNVLDIEAVNIMHALNLACRYDTPRWLIDGIMAFFPFMLLRCWYERATHYCQQALAAARVLNEQESVSATLLHLGTLSIGQGNFTQAKEYAQEGLTLARKTHHLAHCSALLRLLGSIAVKCGDRTQARIYAQEGLALARQVDDVELLCMHLLLAGILHTSSGCYTQADECLQEGLELARSNNLPRVISGLLTALGTLTCMRNEYAQAERYLQEGLRIATDNKNIERGLAFLQGLGVLAGMNGEYAQAEEYFQEALPLAQNLGLREHSTSIHSNLGTIALLRGNGTQAHIHMQEALVRARDIADKNSICNQLISLGTLHRKEGEFATAICSLEEALALAREIGHHYYHSDALLEMAVVMMKQGALQQAKIYLEEGCNIAHTAHNNRFICSFSNGWGEYYLQVHQIDIAASTFQEALELAQKIEEKPVMAQAFYGLARVAHARGDRKEAQMYGQESLRLYEVVDVYGAQEVAQWLETIVS